MRKIKEIFAYKAFFKGLENGYDGIKYKINKKYITTDKLQYRKGGFHMCDEFEDCFFFYKPTSMDVVLTQVRGFGEKYSIDLGENFYDDRFGLCHICEKMEILKVFKRKEIIEMGLKLQGDRLAKFIEFYPLTSEEVIFFKKDRDNGFIDTINYGKMSVVEYIDWWFNIHQSIKEQEWKIL